MERCDDVSMGGRKGGSKNFPRKGKLFISILLGRVWFRLWFLCAMVSATKEKNSRSDLPSVSLPRKDDASIVFLLTAIIIFHH